MIQRFICKLQNYYIFITRDVFDVINYSDQNPKRFKAIEYFYIIIVFAYTISYGNNCEKFDCFTQ